MISPTTVAPPISSTVIIPATPIPLDGPLSTEAIAGITAGGVGGVAVLFLLILLLIVLLCKCNSREGGKASTDSTPFTTAFESPNVDSIHMVTSEAYTAIHSQHIETHGNEAYQTTATADPTEPNAAYGGQVDDRFDCEENAAYDGRVNSDYEENEAYGGRVDNEDNYEYVVPDYQ